VKKAHLNAIKGLSDYVAEWAKSWGPDGYLKAKGMVIAPEDIRTKSADIAAKMTPMDGSSLK
jgi:phosphate transport system substrate-binding protein